MGIHIRLRIQVHRQRCGIRLGQVQLHGWLSGDVCVAKCILERAGEFADAGVVDDRLGRQVSLRVFVYSLRLTNPCVGESGDGICRGCKRDSGVLYRLADHRRYVYHGWI